MNKEKLQQHLSDKMHAPDDPFVETITVLIKRINDAHYCKSGEWLPPDQIIMKALRADQP